MQRSPTRPGVLLVLGGSVLAVVVGLVVLLNSPIWGTEAAAAYLTAPLSAGGDITALTNGFQSAYRMIGAVFLLVGLASVAVRLPILWAVDWSASPTEIREAPGEISANSKTEDGT